MFTPKNLLPLSTINRTKTSCDSIFPIHISTSHTKCWLGTYMQSFGFSRQQKCIHFLLSYHGYITPKFCQTICPYMSSRRNKHMTLKVKQGSPWNMVYIQIKSLDQPNMVYHHFVCLQFA